MEISKLKPVRRIILLALTLSVSLTLLGCAERSTKIVLTAGFEKNEVFKIETMSCSLPELYVYLTNVQNQYEDVYGAQVWTTGVDGETLESSVKENVLAKIAQVKTMNLLAQSYNVTLDETETRLVNEAAEKYYSSLNEDEIAEMGVNQELIAKMYGEYALSNKVYQYLIRDINPEISDDEARTITVEHILIKTYAKDGTGKKINYSERMKNEAYQLAQEVYEKAQDSENYLFEDLIEEYSEDSVATYSFGKGEMDPAFEEAAFNLGNGEISGIVESEYGYHIIKCINTFNRDETDANKLKIVEKRKQEVFGEKYDEFVSGLTRKLNEELWNGLSMIHNDNVTTTSFFEVYDEIVSAHEGL